VPGFSLAAWNSLEEWTTIFSSKAFGAQTWVRTGDLEEKRLRRTCGMNMRPSWHRAHSTALQHATGQVLKSRYYTGSLKVAHFQAA